MVIPTYVLIVLLVLFIWGLHSVLVDDYMSDKYKLENIKKVNITLFVVVLCYICLYIGKVVL